MNFSNASLIFQARQAGHEWAGKILPNVIQNCRENGNSVELWLKETSNRNILDLITRRDSFSWEDSNEGFEYWDRVAKSLKSEDS